MYSGDLTSCKAVQWWLGEDCVRAQKKQIGQRVLEASEVTGGVLE